MKIRIFRVFCCVCLVVLGTSSPQAQTRAVEKVLRYAFEIAETGFDPAQISDYYSRTATENIFDALYRYDYLARPAKVVPNVAQGILPAAALTALTRANPTFTKRPLTLGS